MEDLILKCNTEDGTVLVVLSTPKKEGNLEFLTQDKDGCTILEITPSQTRELIEHLTNCLKEVEGERPLPDTTFKLKSPFGK